MAAAGRGDAGAGAAGVGAARAGTRTRDASASGGNFGEMRGQLLDARAQGLADLAGAHGLHGLVAHGALEVEVEGVLERDAAVLRLARVELVVLLELQLLAQVAQLVGPAPAQDEL